MLTELGPHVKKSFYNKAVQNQIDILKGEVKKKLAVYKSCWENLQKKLSILERLSLLHKLNLYYKTEAEKVLKAHKKKLLNVWNTDRCRSPPCLKSLSKKELSVCEENALRLGLKHHILPKEVRGDSLKVDLEDLIDGILKEKEASKKAETGQWSEISLESEVKDQFKFCLNSFESNCKNVTSSKKNQAVHKTLRKLAQDKNIKVCKFDKGNGAVILDSEDYYKKLDKIISDKTKFQEVLVEEGNHPILKNETSIQNYLRTKVKPFVDEFVYKHLYPSGSQPGKLYGTVKVHKDGNPLRPVISMLNTAEYNLAKWLDTFIKPNIPTAYSVASTDEFLENLKQSVFDPVDKIVSFDVVSLYTNIPLAETIDIIVDTLYSDRSKKVPPVSRDVFRRLLQIATGGMFMHKDTLYKQVDGVAMGSPLGPSLANFFLGHIEETKLFKNEDFYPIVYLRYVDDILAVFESGTTFHPFFKLLNEQHPNLKFTVDEATRSSFPFLNVNIEISGNSVDTWVFRKKTHTNVMLNFTAVVPTVWKTGLIKCLLNNARKICSSDELFKSEVENLKKMFLANGYPQTFFEKTLEKFQASQENVESISLDGSDELDRKHVFGVPWVGNISRDYKKKVTDLVKQHLNVDISTYYTSCKVSSFFSLKSGTPHALKARVVYKFTCLSDSDSYYIGKTKRHLATRAKEHTTPKESTQSEIKNHLFRCDVCKNGDHTVDNFQVMKQCRNDYSAKIHEALLLKKLRPKINKQKYSKGESYLLRIF